MNSLGVKIGRWLVVLNVGLGFILLMIGLFGSGGFLFGPEFAAGLYSILVFVVYKSFTEGYVSVSTNNWLWFLGTAVVIYSVLLYVFGLILGYIIGKLKKKNV